MKRQLIKTLFLSWVLLLLPFALRTAFAVDGQLPVGGQGAESDPKDFTDEDFDSPTYPDSDDFTGSSIIDEEEYTLPDDDADAGVGAEGYPPPSTTTTTTTEGNLPPNSGKNLPPNPTITTPTKTNNTGSGLTGGNPWQEGLSKAGETGLPGGAITDIIFNLAGWFLIILGSIAVIGFVIAGILYLTAAGDDEKMKKAKQGMIYSIIGVVVGLLGYVIVKAVDTWLRGVDDMF